MIAFPLTKCTTSGHEFTVSLMAPAAKSCSPRRMLPTCRTSWRTFWQVATELLPIGVQTASRGFLPHRGRDGPPDSDGDAQLERSTTSHGPIIACRLEGIGSRCQRH